MDTTTNQELNNLLNLQKVNGNERIKIIAICNDTIGNATVMNDIENSIKNVIEQKNFSLGQCIPSLISSILSITKNIQYYKEVNETRIVFVIYSVLISALLKFHPNLLKTIEIDTLRNIYVNTIDLVLLVPETVKITKRGCLTCLGNSVKVLNFLNKGKIII